VGLWRRAGAVRDEGKLERCGGPGWKCVGKEEAGKGKGVWEFGSLGCGKEWEWSERSGENNFFCLCVWRVGRKWAGKWQSGSCGGEVGRKAEREELGWEKRAEEVGEKGVWGVCREQFFFVGVERGDGVVCVSTGRTEEETGVWVCGKK